MLSLTAFLLTTTVHAETPVCRVPVQSIPIARQRKIEGKLELMYAGTGGSVAGAKSESDLSAPVLPSVSVVDKLWIKYEACLDWQQGLITQETYLELLREQGLLPSGAAEAESGVDDIDDE